MSDRQLFIGNLCNVSNEQLRSYCETYGSLAELSVNRDKENNIYHCFAFVTFQSARCLSQFMANRPHVINGDAIFVKRALQRGSSSIPERLIVTNRLILEDFDKRDKHLLRDYFQKYGHIKKFSIDHGFIDYDDYDDVDRVLLARPHYIRDKEVFVTKFVPSEPHDGSSRHNHHHHHQHHHRSHDHRHLHRPTYDDELQTKRIIKTSTETPQLCRTRRIERCSLGITITDQPAAEERDEEDENEDDESSDGEIDAQHSNVRYEHLQEQFEQYKQSKEMELCALRMNLERTKQQLADMTQEKLDLLIKNQHSFHNQLTLRLFPDDAAASHPQTAEDCLRLTPNKLAKKRKLATTSSSPSSSTSFIAREYEYYS